MCLSALLERALLGGLNQAELNDLVVERNAELSGCSASSLPSSLGTEVVCDSAYYHYQDYYPYGQIDGIGFLGWG